MERSSYYTHRNGTCQVFQLVVKQLFDLWIIPNLKPKGKEVPLLTRFAIKFKERERRKRGKNKTKKRKKIITTNKEEFRMATPNRLSMNSTTIFL